MFECRGASVGHNVAWAAVSIPKHSYHSSRKDVKGRLSGKGNTFYYTNRYSYFKGHILDSHDFFKVRSRSYKFQVKCKCP